MRDDDATMHDAQFQDASCVLAKQIGDRGTVMPRSFVYYFYICEISSCTNTIGNLAGGGDHADPDNYVFLTVEVRALVRRKTNA